MPNRRPQALFLVHRIPYPPNRGDRIRSFHLLEFLAARADVWLAFLSEAPPTDEALRALAERCARVEAVDLDRTGRWFRAAWSLAAGRTATEGLFAAPALRRALGQWGREVRFDVAVVFCSSMAQYLSAAGLEGVRTVVDLVDVDSQKWFDYAATSRGLRRALFSLEGRRLRRLETAIAQRAAFVTLVSAQEAAIFRGFCPADTVRVVPNGVDLEYFRPVPQEEGPSPRCVFVGALDYRANVDGLAWFCEAVWPEVIKRRPGATFAVVGSNPSPAARKLGTLPGVELVGEVPDVRPHLASAAVVVVPLRVARGLQNKVLEAWAMRRAVVASPQALEGLAIEPGVHACRADEPGQWVETIAELLDDPERRERLGRAGREYVEAHHRWEECLAQLAELLGLPGEDSA